MSMEQTMKELQKQTQCPYADGKLLIYAKAMDPYNRRYIILECPAKRRTITNSEEWKVFEEEIRAVCCNSKFAQVCDAYKNVNKKK